MTYTRFPAIPPSEHPTITAGRFPHVRKRSTGGRLVLIRMGNAQLDGEISLPYTNIDTPDLVRLLAHWRAVKGTARDFVLPADLFPSMNSATKALLMATVWRFSEPPKVVDICGGVPGRLLHSLEFTLQAQPRRVASPVENGLPELPAVAPGARWGAVMTWEPGLAGVNIIRPRGAEWTVRVGWQKGLAQIIGDGQAPGAQWGVTTTWAAGARSTPPAAWQATAAWVGGAARVEGPAPGATWNAQASFQGGAATLPPQFAPGASWSASAQWAAGSGVLPGASWQATAAWAGGAGSLGGTAPGASWQATAAWAGGAGSLQDPNFAGTSLLLPFDGANNSTTFTDRSTNNFTATRYGNVIISTDQSVYGGASAYFDGTGDYISFGQQAALQLNAAYTIECWIRLDAINRQHTVGTSADFSNIQIFRFGQSSFQNLSIYINNQTIFNQNVGTQALVWQHLALTRDSNGNTRVFANGIQQGSTITTNYGTFRMDTIGCTMFGGLSNQQILQEFKGFIDDLRITKGVARYTANFTPSGPHPTS